MMNFAFIIDHPCITSHLIEVEAASENMWSDTPTGWQKKMSELRSEYFRSLLEDAKKRYVAKLESVGLAISDDPYLPENMSADNKHDVEILKHEGAL